VTPDRLGQQLLGQEFSRAATIHATT
jgi:hypothetical protein